MTKSIWVTILEKDEAKGKALFEAIHRYGLGVNGHFWVDDLEKMQWAAAFSEISKPDTALWLIKGTLKSLQDDTTRYGLAMLAVMAQAMKGHGFPIVLIAEDGPLDPATLPTPLKGAVIAADDASLMAKLVAKANTPGGQGAHRVPPGTSTPCPGSASGSRSDPPRATNGPEPFSARTGPRWTPTAQAPGARFRKRPCWNTP